MPPTNADKKIDPFEEKMKKRDEDQARGTRNLESHAAAQAAKGDGDRAGEQGEAERQISAARADEEKRREAGRDKRARDVKRLPKRTLRAGTAVHLNGHTVYLGEETTVHAAGLGDESTFAALLARDSANLELNAASLRLVYNQMNGAPLPLGEQKLPPDEMTDAERSLFGLPPKPAAQPQPQGAQEVGK